MRNKVFVASNSDLLDFSRNDDSFVLFFRNNNNSKNKRERERERVRERKEREER